MQQKKGICELQIEWSGAFDGSRNNLIEYEVLQGLRPYEKLRSLKVLYYGGTKFPNWVGDPSFVCLTEVKLSGCKHCKCLPTLGYLQLLKKLFVERMHELERVGSELLGHTNSCSGNAFPSLDVLEFKDMESWKEWSTCGGENRGSFPCLREIYITNCPKLDIVAIDPIPSLQVLHVSRCSIVVLKSMVATSSSIARLEMFDIQGLSQLHVDVLKHLKEVKYLNISRCIDLRYLWESEAVACDILRSLKKLNIRWCNRLESLGEKEVHLGTSMESIKEVSIQCCRSLKTYNCPNRIEKLSLRFCPLVTLMDGLPSTLKILDISGCGNLEVRWSPIKLSSLESLDIQEMPNMRLFPEGCLSYLTSLTIWGCDNIESIPDNGYGFFPSLCLKVLYIDECKNLKSFPHEHLQSLTSLVEMEICNCPCLDYSFPSGLWPPNLSFLKIGGLKKPVSEWGLQNFPTSLIKLWLVGGENLGVVAFAAKPEEDISSFLLPSSLTELKIMDLMELESLSEGLNHLTCLQHLSIFSCKKVRDIPEALLPSLLSLSMSYCSPELRKKCSPGRKGKYWPIISQIPHLTLKDENGF